MARKEHDCRQRELEHAKEMAILIADKKVAIANAKLKAIEEALQEGELGESQYSRNSRWELRRGRMTG
jgi:hypothetical protein